MRRLGGRALLIFLTLAFLGLQPIMASATDEKDVEQAEAARKAAYDRLVEVNQELEAAILEYQEINAELDELTHRIEVILDRIADHESSVAMLKIRARELVTQAYITSGNSDIIEIAFEADSIQDLLTSQVLLDRAGDRDLVELDRLDALTREMDRLRETVKTDQDRVQELSDEAAAVVGRLDELQAEQAAEYERQDSAARQARTEYEAEQRRKALEEAAKKRGSDRGVGPVRGFVCPVAGNVSFINDWGFPRSGGRRHQGNDMFASRGTPVVAVSNGTLSLKSNRLGGISAYLRTSSAMYYYAHLDGYAANVSSGQSLSAGDVIGYVGNTGNARGSSPHLHFQMHPGGGAPVNPYPTISSAC